MSGNWKVYVPLEVRQYSDLSRQLKSNKMVQHTDRQDRADYFWYETRSQLSLSKKIETQTINTMLWLFNVLYQITVLPHFKRHVNSSSFLYLLEAWNKHEWTSQRILFKPRKDVNTHNFSSLSLFYCPVWFVGQDGEFSIMIGQIACQSSSLRRVSCAGSCCLFSIWQPT